MGSGGGEGGGEGCSFYRKNNRKSEKFINKNVFLCHNVITKNLNREILTKNLVILKKWDTLE